MVHTTLIPVADVLLAFARRRPLRRRKHQPAGRTIILGERDAARLERWIARAITCTAAAELLAEP
jgi:hypothetical protein